MKALLFKLFSYLLPLFFLTGLITHLLGSGQPCVGRWDLTLMWGGTRRACWLEITEEKGSFSGRFGGPTGSASPVSNLRLDGSRLTFSTRDYWYSDGKGWMDVAFAVNVDQISGLVTRAHETIEVNGRRAPILRTTRRPRWGDPLPIFNGKDLTGWRLTDPSASNWIVEEGLLVNKGKGANIVTEQQFQDFRLHIEFNCPPGCNSGIYLRGRYEVQIEDNELHAPLTNRMGAIYGFIAPEVQIPRRAGEWQTFDITLLGRSVSVLHNSRLIIRNREIPGITGGAMDSDEGQPGPLYLQGDHGGLAFRHIVITPAR